MAPSLSNAKLLASSIIDGLFLTLSRRGYAATSQVFVSVSAGLDKQGSRTDLVVNREETVVIKEKSWAPDPITGYYMPNNCAAKIDAAELREMVLNHKVKPHSEDNK